MINVEHKLKIIPRRITVRVPENVTQYNENNFKPILPLIVNRVDKRNKFLYLLSTSDIKTIKNIISTNKQKLFDNTISCETNPNYKRGITQFSALMQKLNRPIVFSQNNLTDYISLRLQTNVSKGTVWNELNGICNYFIMKGEKISLNKQAFPLISKIMKAFAILHGEKTEARIALDIKEITYISNKLNESTDPICVTYRTAFILAFWCMLRPGEYTFKSNKTGIKLRNEHVRTIKSGPTPFLKITLISPKTNKPGEQYVVVSCKCSIHKIVCPYHTVLNYIEFKKINYNLQQIGNPGDSFFVIPNPYNKNIKYSPINYDKWCKWFKSLYNIIDIEGLFTPHSLRISGASYYFNAGLPAYLIQILGRWKSECWKRYIRINDKQSIVMVDKILNEQIYTNGLTEIQLLQLINNPSSNARIANELRKRVYTGKASITFNNEPPPLTPIKSINDKTFPSPNDTPASNKKRYIYPINKFNSFK